MKDGLLWDLAAVCPAGARRDDRLPPAVVFNGPVVEIIDAIQPSLAARH